MKIKDAYLDTGAPLSRVGERKPHHTRASTSGMCVGTSGDRIELSQGTRYLLELKNELASFSGVREEQVHRITKMLREGRYSVASGDVADRILAHSVGNATGRERADE